METYQEKLTLKMCLTYLIFLFSLVGVKAADWSYSNVTAWGQAYPNCNGKNQSPINLDIFEAKIKRIPALKLNHYGENLKTPLTLLNNGHSIQLNIPETVDGNQASLSGSILSDEYKAKSLHFHWGSKGNPGSEHFINGKQYDAELHIVHQKKSYSDEEAPKYPDGLAVLGVMFKGVNSKSLLNSGLEIITNHIPEVIKYKSSISIEEDFSLSHLIEGLDDSSFFTYNGSLTTPGCNEAVVWHVLDNPIYVSKIQLSKFFNLKSNEQGNPLVNNYRPLQKINNRQILYGL